MKNVANGTDVKLFVHKLYLLSYFSLFTKVCYGTRHYLSWHSACLYSLKWFWFYSHIALQLITAAHSSISTLKALCFLWALLSLTGIICFFFFSILCLILFHIQPGEERPLPQRMKRLLELIFICCAVPMAFLECVMYYHQVLIMQLKCKKFKSSALLALSAVCTLPKALLEQIHDHFWFKITICLKKKNLIDDA